MHRYPFVLHALRRGLAITTSAAAIILSQQACAGDTTSPPVATKLSLATAPSAAAASRETFAVQPVIQLQDASGNAVAQTGTVVATSITAGGGALAGTITASTGSNGAAIFSNLSISGAVGPQTLSFSAPGLTSVTATITLTAGTATTIVVNAGNNQSATAGSAVATLPSVKVADADGNAVSGQAVTFAVSTGGGAITGANQTTSANGVATVGSWTLGPVAGANLLTATATGLTGSPFTITATIEATANRGPVASVTIAPLTATVTAGDFIQLSATAVDAFGNTVTKSGTWSSSNTTAASVTPTGMLLALAGASTTITASIDGVSGLLPVSINKPSIPAGTLQITFGPVETVFHWATDKCEQNDAPDLPAHPVRLADNSLLLIAGNSPHTFVWRGADFNSLKHDCAAVLTAADRTNPESYENQEWVHAPYRVANVIHALIHNEYHDPIAPNCQPGNTSPGNPCWYNSITYAYSTDGGKTFAKPPSPAHLVAPAPLKWDPNSPEANKQPHGYFNPSNIVQRGDGFYYTLFFAIPDPRDASTRARGICVMRTITLDDPSSWRAWDGSGYNLSMASPYRTGTATPPCKIVSLGLTSDAHGSLTFNTYLNRYMMTGPTFRNVNGSVVCGFYYTTSTDLINWDEVKPYKVGYLTFDPCRPPGGNNAGADLYASIVDHADQTTNFERAGQTPYVYYTHYNNSNFADRDLQRRRMIIVAP